MQRLILWVLAICGLALMICGLGLLQGGRVVAAQDELEDAEYEGARECTSCHRGLSRSHRETRHALTLQDVSRNKALILADFEQGEEVRSVQFPGDSEPRPFQADDIAYAVGSGRIVQRYLYEVDRNEYMILPAQWNVNTQSWEPYILGDEWPGDAYAFGPNCAGCHTTGIDTRRFRWRDDGVQCEACHGPGSVHVEAADDDEDLEIVRAGIVRSPDAQICGQCHSRGAEPEEGLPYPAAYQPGVTMLLDEDVFVLVLPDDSVHWYASGHARQQNMQFNEWLESAHASALTTMRESAAAADGCLSCHSGDYRYTQALIALVEAGEREGDAPDAVTVETAQLGVTCITCHNPHSREGFPAQLANEPYALCVDCHSNPAGTEGLHHPVREMFEGIALVSNIEGVPGDHFTAAEGPDCLTCHMPDVPVEYAGQRASHVFTPILPGESDELPSACAGCHEDLTVTDLQLLVEETQQDVRTRLSVARARLASVTEPEPGTEARALYDRVVAALDFVQNDGSLGIHNYAYADALLTTAEQTLTSLSVPGARLQPTEAPAPTATPAAPPAPIRAAEAASGIRPVTMLVIGLVVLILLFSAVAFFRSPASREV